MSEPPLVGSDWLPIVDATRRAAMIYLFRDRRPHLMRVWYGDDVDFDSVGPPFARLDALFERIEPWRSVWRPGQIERWRRWVGETFEAEDICVDVAFSMLRRTEGREGWPERHVVLLEWLYDVVDAHERGLRLSRAC